MNDYMGDLSSYFAASTANSGSRTTSVASSSASTKDSTSLDMTDFLTLMVAQFQNQSIDNTADTSDMLNQLVQMSVVQAITNITDATVMMYAGSLVGKEVTVGKYGNDGTLEEVVGTVTGTGVLGGQQVIFVDGKSYYLNEIMAVGRLPEVETPEGGEGTGDGEETGDGEDSGDTGDTQV